MAFLILPGLSIALRFETHSQFALRFVPQRVHGRLLMVMILFISYSAVTAFIVGRRIAALHCAFVLLQARPEPT